MTVTQGKKVILKEALEAFSADLLRAGGLDAKYASQSAELLVWANLRGAESHGVLRIPRYIEMVELGIVKGNANPVVAREFGAITVIEGDLVPGASGMAMAADKAIELATQFGIGFCSVVRTSHAGAIGYFAEKVAKSGMVGMVMTASKPLMVYHGSRAQGVSTNPLSIAAPSKNPARPIILDMSTAAVALGKVMAAKDAGRSIPHDWGVDSTGVATTDPAKVKAVLPMAGPKGSGLSLMIEILVSVLGGNPLISAALMEKTDAGFNGLVIAISPSAFGADAGFEENVDQLARAIKSLPPAIGVDEVFLPGERGFRLAEKRLEKGIPLASGTVGRLVEEARKYGISVPLELL
ncbi:Ldh family oxidoreductase [Rhizobium leguminosarum bv. viciae]|uniref:Ureidoglycolate dehydrogenase (NAD+) n=2 Tax=Rhizobium TaxID=379 RepID=A0AAX2QAG4_9HYPH|nr:MULTISPECIES: Ldh family oxidoreductase [Rhizobium]MBY3172957.1 Ldh family oxidoreductase [Rhizobium laguerreae]MBY3300058.1 Ldh family oxidoreductase [Rhizobium laguerreae]MBY5421058.1 Ldh family oxidoreductase [Rhizobium leguminosarum]MBY5427051.1 Ldh family oxidoreductase [Rhizobium leguminosarum]MBY5794042.1 Ldh family oxidoreductase [Rhizobium leguminosarum]